MIRRHRIECLGNRDHAGPEGNRGTGSRSGLIGSIVPNRNVLHDRKQATSGTARAKDLPTDAPGVHHDSGFFGIERSGFVEDPVRNSDHPEIVQQGSDLDCLTFLDTESHLAGPGRAQQGYVEIVDRCRRVLTSQGNVQPCRRTQSSFDQELISLGIDNGRQPCRSACCDLQFTKQLSERRQMFAARPDRVDDSGRRRAVDFV